MNRETLKWLVADYIILTWSLTSPKHLPGTLKNVLLSTMVDNRLLIADRAKHLQKETRAHINYKHILNLSLKILV